ncbi:amyloid fiber anchoring/assembly protein TapA [Bacillus haynesii]|uniref:amyloid fiber anchoring/assembly protein TapA n=2 Tax=Bacillus haynesii TaxID=1925021 RepID=UPI001C247894|nr:amyloid fiber anchoring/assembly protein TapA [Bacillus haynesii]MBU8684251.1 amyloid fiber anchoring/assembly protein TapA [Bacillus haynesii]MCY8093361.1 amyloid fiber anchoring/assembly protein TapA [Bacillus haynesii]MCY8293512.1 amyloid fiber anchoring/assembly protein TapA [Bacillus haynesii]MCY8410242.1 amyloid fiber anchoring/assembly protein TapA [Bacillus haynesii]MCY8433738.1 amyloid fiber anchoring/assembly protein TapA [Bacillus haynesii]
MIRLSRTRRCRKRAGKNIIVFQTLLIIYLLIGLGSQLSQHTNASFHDVETYSMTMKAASSFPQDEKQWDGSDLKLQKQTKTKGTVCAPLTLFAEYKNRGSQIADSEWKWELHKLGHSKKPLEDGTVIDKGVFKKEEKSIYRIESNRAAKGGLYAFKLIKPEGHPDVKKGKPFIWSNVMELQDCKEETPKPPKKASAKPKQTEQTQTPQKSKQDIEETPKGSEFVDKENGKEENSLESGEAS